MTHKRTLVVGDTHGAYNGLIQALQRADFEPERDRLICLGDVQDGWSEAPRIIDFLMGLDSRGSLIYCLGNHDAAFIEFVDGGCKRHIMEGHGGYVTRYVYSQQDIDVALRHAEWLRAQRHAFQDEDGSIYVHAGWSPEYAFDNPGQKNMQEYLWNRSFWQGMYEGRNYAKHHKQVFVGHSPTIRHKPFTDKPMQRRNVWNLDTGAAFTGRVTVMDANTHEYWQSDKCKDLYPLERGRN